MMGHATRPSLRWVWSLFRTYRAGVVCLCLGTAAQAAVQVALAVLTRDVIDAGIGGESRFFRLGALLLAALVLLVLLRAVLSWAAGRITDHAAADLRWSLLSAAERSGEGRAYSSGALLDRGLEDVRILCRGMTDLLPTLFGSVTRLAGAFLVLSAICPPVAGVLAVAGAAIGAGALLLRPVLRENHRLVRQAEERAFSEMKEYAQQLELIQALGAEGESLRRFRALLDRGLRTKRRRRAWSVGGGGALSLLTQLGTGAALLWGVHAVFTGALSYGGLTAILQLLAQFRAPVVSLSGLWGRLAAVEVSGERLRETLEPDGGPEEPEDPAPTAVTAVVLEDVTFRYRPEEPPVLEHYSARFDLTGWTCLSGPSGRGKTTVFRLILGIVRPQSGRVYLETDRGERPCGKAARRWFAYVPQDFSLFSGSIRENLLLAAPEADEAACRAALDTAQAGFVFDLSAGLDAQVMEQRSGLSMGQLQRLAVARAVLMDRPVLLLDECTSALDAETERTVLAALRATGRGAVLVTHRPSALEGLGDVRSVDMEGCV